MGKALEYGLFGGIILIGIIFFGMFIFFGIKLLQISPSFIIPVTIVFIILMVILILAGFGKINFGIKFKF